MSYQALVGAKFYISTGLDAAKVLSSVTNAAPPVFNSTAHGYSNTDELLVLNNWDDFNESIIRASSVSTNSLAAAGYDTTNTDYYPAASSAGTLQKISGWLEIGQVLGITPSGGEAKFEEVNPFDRRNGVKIPTGFSASSLEMTLGWDRSRGDQQAFQAAARGSSKRAIKFVLPGGVFGYCYGTVSASALPMFETILKQKVSLAMNGQFTTFTA